MKFNELKISNFRGIDYAELKEMKHLNLIVGKNNSGKTSIMEAVFVLSGMSNPRLLLNINSYRHLMLIEDSDFRYVFNNLNLEKPIELSGNVSDIERSLKITPYKGTQQSITMQKQPAFFNQENVQPFGFNLPSLETSLQIEQMRLGNRGNEIDGLKLSFKNGATPEEDVYISLNNKTINFSNSYKESLSVRYLNSQLLLMNGMINLSSMVRKKKIKDIVDILKQIEPNLTDIQIINDNAIYFDVGKEELLPINIMGDGIIRTLAVLANIYDMKGGVLLLDEVENGLHYSTMKVFWKAVLLLATKLDVQIIATTHSYEALGALVDVKEELETENESSPEATLYRIERDEDKTKIIQFNNDAFVFGLNQNYEVR